MPNPYTGTENDPFQEAQHRYLGPQWEQFFGSLKGKNVRFAGAAGGPSTSERMREQIAASDFRDPSQDTARTLAMSDYSDNYHRQQQGDRILASQADIAEAQARGIAQQEQDAEQTRRAMEGYGTAPAEIMGTPGGPRKARPSGVPLPPAEARAQALAKMPLPMRQAYEKQYAAQDAEARVAQLAAQKEAEVVRHNRATETAGAVPTVSPEGIEVAARNYLTTGQMPPLGMGDKTTRQAIINRAGELGGAGASIAANKADYKADSGSLSALQKQRDAIGAFESTAGKNIDIFLDTAGKVVDTGSPLANTLLRAATGKMLGSPDQAKYDAARQVAINEIAKITANPTLSGQLSDSARHEVEAFNPAGATLAQTVAVMRLLKQDMGNRITSLDDQVKDIKGRLKAGSAPSAPAGFVDMVAPDGRPLHVPAGEVDALLKHGAKRAGGG